MPRKAFYPAVTVTLRRLSHLGDGAGDSEIAVLLLHKGQQPSVQSTNVPSQHDAAPQVDCTRLKAVIVLPWDFNISPLKTLADEE